MNFTVTDSNGELPPTMKWPCIEAASKLSGVMHKIMSYGCRQEVPRQLSPTPLKTRFGCTWHSRIYRCPSRRQRGGETTHVSTRRWLVLHDASSVRRPPLYRVSGCTAQPGFCTRIDRTDCYVCAWRCCHENQV